MEINETQENSEIANDFFREMSKGEPQILERHGTWGGITNFYRYLSFWIKRNRDKTKPIQEGGKSRLLLKKNDFIKNRAYIVFSVDASKKLETNNMMSVIADNKMPYYLVNKVFKSWNIGKYMGHPYKYKNGVIFNEDSICIELLGIKNKGLMEFAKEMCKFGDTIIFENVKDYEIYFLGKREK